MFEGRRKVPSILSLLALYRTAFVEDWKIIPVVLREIRIL